MEDLTGQQLGPYRIVAPLGEGGMAAVYKAYQPGVDRYVALKILARHYADDPNFVARFRQEAQVIANLQHPHILQVYDFGEADRYTYIVMPFVEYGTLADLVNSHPLSLKQIRTIIAQVGDALDYAHSRGLVHRDVKPSNVLIDERGNCLLTDFGIAKIVEGTAHLTTTGSIVGTPAYMSPEQGLAQKIDGRSDIYSLGVMLYQMATGRVPFVAETPMAIVIKHIHDALPPPRSLNPALPEAVERVILKALAKNPEDRYQTAGAMVAALNAASEAEQSGVTAPTLTEQVIKRRRAVPLWARVLAVVVGLAVLAGGVWFGVTNSNIAQVSATQSPATKIAQATATLVLQASPTQVATSELPLTSATGTAPVTAPTAVSEWVVAKGGEDLLTFPGWVGCGDFAGGEFTISGSDTEFCNVGITSFYLKVSGAWGVRGIVEASRDVRYAALGFTRSKIDVEVGFYDGHVGFAIYRNGDPYYSNRFDRRPADGRNELELRSEGDRYEIYLNGVEAGEVKPPDTEVIFDSGSIYAGAVVGPKDSFTAYRLSVIVPADRPNNVAISTTP